ncbi:MAG: class I SAM-dependent methyltransferase [Geminicoccaceae bacterium]
MTASSTFTASDGAAYEQMMGRWSRRLAEPFLDFAGEVAGDCLDLGCGTGSLTAAILRRAPQSRVTGLDFSPAYVAHAQARPDTVGAGFQVGDACAMPFADGSFDRILSLLMLHFVPRGEAAVAEIRRVARPGAVAAATVWDARGGLVAHRLFYDTAAMLDPEADRLRARNYVRPMTRPGELGAAWRAAGFRDVVETLLTVRMEFAEFADYWRPFLGGQGPTAAYVAGLDPAARERLREHVRRAYLDGEPDGPRSYAASAWAVRGTAPDLDPGPTSR